MVSEYINKVDGQLGGCDYILAAIADALAAAFALEYVVGRAYPADGHFALDAPVGIEEPAVAVAQTCADEPALIAVVAQVAQIPSENIARESYMTDVVLTAQAVEGEEMARCGLAQPEACFGLYQPVLPVARTA